MNKLSTKVPPEIRALADLRTLHKKAVEESGRQLGALGWAIPGGGTPDLGEVTEALSDMIDLADAWATCGPQGYTPEERRRRNGAERVLMRLYARIERERSTA